MQRYFDLLHKEGNAHTIMNIYMCSRLDFGNRLVSDVTYTLCLG